MVEKYGKTNEEKHTDETLQSREIVSEIVNFGVTETQKIQIIKLLALELESNDSMKTIVKTINKVINNNSESDKNKTLITA